MKTLKPTVSRYTIVLINHGKTMQDHDAEFKDFSMLIRTGKEQVVVQKLEARHNMRCCVFVNEG